MMYGFPARLYHRMRKEIKRKLAAWMEYDIMNKSDATGGTLMMNIRRAAAVLLALLMLLIAPAALAKTITVDAADYDVEEGGRYDTMEEVAIYLTFFDELPENYITKKEAQALGWDNRKGNLWKVADGCSIGGDRFGNYEGLLPDAKGRRWTECDIGFDGGYRNGRRIVFSNDGLIYYTADHYQSFDEIEVIWTDTEDSFLSGEDLKSFVKWLFEE